MNKKCIVILIFIFFILLLSGCTENYIQGEGIIIYNDFEGGFYGIIGDNGENYDPINLEKEFQEDGIIVSYTLKVLEDQLSIHQWGIVVEIIEIERI